MQSAASSVSNGLKYIMLDDDLSQKIVYAENELGSSLIDNTVFINVLQCDMILISREAYFFCETMFVVT